MTTWVGTSTCGCLTTSTSRAGQGRTGPGALQEHALPVLPEDVAQRVGDLPERGVGLHRIQDERDEVLAGGPGGGAEGVGGASSGVIAAAGPERLEPLLLLLL